LRREIVPKYPIPVFTQTVASPWFTSEYTTHVTGVVTAWNDSGDTTVSFATLAPNVRLALVDMSYNIGFGFIDDFTKMVTYINSGGNYLAFAGFEMMDSDYATEVPNRATLNFRLIVSGHEAGL
jgi:hypothetical protein